MCELSIQHNSKLTEQFIAHGKIDQSEWLSKRDYLNNGLKTGLVKKEEATTYGRLHVCVVTFSRFMKIEAGWPSAD